MTRTAEFKFDPDPPVEGQPVVITFPGPGPWFVREDGSTGGWTEIDVDPESNTARLDAPPATGGGSISVSDIELPETPTSTSVTSGD
jgi:hypothetical protein